MVLIPLTVALPLLAAALLAALRQVLPRPVGDASAIVAASAATALLVALAVLAARHGTLVYWFGGWRPANGVALGIGFAADPFSTVVAASCSVLVTASLCFAWRYFDSLGTLFPTLLLVFAASVAGYCLTADLFTLFVFFELMSAAAYALTAFEIEAESLEGALTFAIVNSLGAFLILWGIGLLYGRFGALNMAQLGDALAAAGPPGPRDVAAFALLATGFLTKAGIVPFQFWHADADAVAPTPVCVLISGAMAPLGLYGLVRVYFAVFAGAFPAQGGTWTVLLWLGAATALLGAVLCTRQRHLKRLLAFSTIGHVGMMLSGLASGTAAGIGGVTVYLGSHGLVKGALFLAVGGVLHRFGSVDRPALHGQGRGHPWLGALFVLGALGLAGLPPFGTFTGKTLMEAAMKGHGSWAELLIPAVFTLSSGLTAGAVLRAAANIFLGWGRPPDDSDSPTARDGAETRQGSEEMPLPLMLTPSVMLGLALAVGLVPGVRGRALGAAALVLDWRGYRDTVLRGTHAGPLPLLATPGVGESLVLMEVGLGIAVLYAAASIFGYRLPGALRSLASTAGGPVRLLERLHSGLVNDYVAWLAFGCAVLGAAFAASLGVGP